MSVIKPLPAVKFFLAAFGPDPKALDRAARRLLSAPPGSLLGSVDVAGPDFPVPAGGYYEAEMGGGLVKRHMSFAEPGPPDLLVELKLRTMEIERAMARPDGTRLVNLDPGYVFSGGLVLATAKFSGHRLHLGRGVWGELTLHYHRGRFRTMPWTYPDYQGPDVLELLARMRRAHLSARPKDDAESTGDAGAPGGPPRKGPTQP